MFSGKVLSLPYFLFPRHLLLPTVKNMVSFSKEIFTEGSF